MTRFVQRVQPHAVQVWRLYRFYSSDGSLLYIGQTGRIPLARLVEHLYEQGWAGEIARWEVDPRTWAAEADVLAAEKAAIRAEKPRHNWEHNEGPHRVWVPKVSSYRQRTRRPAPAGRRLPPRWRRRRDWAAGLAVGWLAVTLLLWWADAAVTVVDVPGRTYPIAAAAFIVLVPVSRLRRRRDVKAGVVVVTVACTAIWLLTG